MREAHLRLEVLQETTQHLEVHLRNKLSRLIWFTRLGARRLSDDVDAQSLTLKWSPALGHYCHVKGKDISIQGVTIVQTSKSTRSFLNPVRWSPPQLPSDLPPFIRVIVTLEAEMNSFGGKKYRNGQSLVKASLPRGSEFAQRRRLCFKGS